MAGVFSIFAGVYYWFPLLTGRLMNETLGKIHFWISLIAAYGTFFPMHFAGLAGEPRHYERLTGPAHSFTALLPLERGITYSALLLAAVQFVFLWNIVRSARRGRPAGENPWAATTLEWAPMQITEVKRGPYEYGFRSSEADFISQWDTEAERE
jgi:cytochrome c oxidase subunit I